MSTSDQSWTIGRLLTWTTDYLQKHGAENPRLDAEVLLADARGCQRIDLYASYGDEPTEPVRTTFRELVRRRAAGEPVAYLVGHREFYALDFEVNPDVLIPRPETELLVVALLDQVKLRAEADRPFRIADIGTGSGILAICAAKHVKNARITAIDVSPAAIAVARRNAQRHDVADRIQFVESNLFDNVPAGETYDFIVSNPPYVSTEEMAKLPVDVRDHEPHVALAAGGCGTDVIAPLVAQSTERLAQSGMLLIEISPMIADSVEQIIGKHDSLMYNETIRDLAGHARAIRATKR